MGGIMEMLRRADQDHPQAVMMIGWEGVQIETILR